MEASVAGLGSRLVMLRHPTHGHPVSWGYSINAGLSWKDGGGFPGNIYVGVFPGGHALCSDSQERFFAVGRWNASSPTYGLSIALLRGAFQDTTFTWEPNPSLIIPTLSFSYGIGPDFLQLLCGPQDQLYLIYTETNDGSGSPPPPAQGIVKVTRSLDQGVTWSTPVALSGMYCSDSRAALGPDGELVVVWQDFATRQIAGRKSLDQGVSFGPTFVVGPVIENLSTPVGHDGAVHEAIGHPEMGSFGPGHLSLAVDRSTSPARGRIYVAWTERAEGTPLPISGTANDVESNNTPALASRVDIGQGFGGRKEGVPHTSADCDWFYFEGARGTTIHLEGWACGVDGKGFPISSLQVPLFCGTETAISMTLRSTTFHCTEYRPPLIYTLPATGRYYMFMSCSDRILNYGAALEEFVVSPASVARDHRDVVLAWSADGGTTWSPKRRLNDCEPGCEDAMPVLAVDHLGRLHAMWYDRRDPPWECAATVHTYWTWSEDGGVTLAPAQRLSETAADLRAIWAGRGGTFQGDAPGWTVGDYATLTTIGEKVYAFWTQPELSGYDAQGDLHGAIIEDDGITATEVRGFGAEWVTGRVRVWWSVANATDVIGFRLHRANDASDEYAPLNEGSLIPFGGRTEHELEDASASPGQRYRYRLEVVRSGGSLWQGPIEVMTPPVTIRLAWEGGRPNPFIERVDLRLEVSQEAHGLVVVYDVSGQAVRRLHRGRFLAGTTTLSWDGRDGRGRRVAPGVYLIRASVDGDTRTLRIVRIE